MSENWVTKAVEVLSSPECVKTLLDSKAREQFADRCQEQTVHCSDKQFLHGALIECRGGVRDYRQHCQAALGLLRQAQTVQVPFVGMEPHPQDRPERIDRWHRDRQRREESLKQLGKLFGEAGETLKKAEAVLQRALSPEPDRQLAGAGKGGK